MRLRETRVPSPQGLKFCPQSRGVSENIRISRPKEIHHVIHDPGVMTKQFVEASGNSQKVFSKTKKIGNSLWVLIPKVMMSGSYTKVDLYPDNFMRNQGDC